jgi:hypothetical protein
MKVTTNLLAADETHKTAWLPQGAVLLVSTTDPQNTQYIDVEIWDKDHNPITFGQTDPAFGMSDFVRLKLLRYGRDLTGIATMKVRWADSSYQEYGEDSEFLIS